MTSYDFPWIRRLNYVWPNANSTIVSSVEGEWGLRRLRVCWFTAMKFHPSCQTVPHLRKSLAKNESMTCGIKDGKIVACSKQLPHEVW
jgi:hypothetical protein